MNSQIILEFLTLSVIIFSQNASAWTHKLGKFGRWPIDLEHSLMNSSTVDYETHFMKMPVDHFGYANQDTFQLRYLFSDKHWGGDGHPIFFYTGNEGDIAWFCNNTGFMWDIAPEFKAMLVFAEHRYYGESMPYGKDSYKDPAHLGYLSSEQALADFADVITQLKARIPGADKSPVISFGGSYGGMLAAWFRIKYPHVTQGALAASAPVLWFEELTPCNAFSRSVTHDFAIESKECVANINSTWGVINTMASTESGRASLSSSLKLCSPLKNEAEALHIKDWLVDVLGNIAMVDYPYPSSFLEPLPGWPIKKFCEPLAKELVSSVDLMEGLADSLNVFFNYTGNVQCFNSSQQASVASMSDLGWDFQACTEMVMPMCSDGIHDMFEPTTWNLTEFTEGCKKRWNVTSRPNWMITQYGGKDIAAASNIIFSNGKLDPWSGGGVHESYSHSLVAIEIEKGAHHLDLRFSDPEDPPCVIKARKEEKRLITKWIKEYSQDTEEEDSYIFFGMNFALDTDVEYTPVETDGKWSMCFVLFGALSFILLVTVLLNSLRGMFRVRIMTASHRSLVATPAELNLMFAEHGKHAPSSHAQNGWDYQPAEAAPLPAKMQI